MTPNEQQAAAWNGPESRHYVDHADRYDRQLLPFSAAMLARAAITSRDTVLDIGCGSGATALDAARTAQRVVGVDISEPLLAVAAERARAGAFDNVEFRRADAQTCAFDAEFDVLVSQFGLMFFDEPTRAFTNLRQALAPGGRIAFVCWQGLEANDWLTVVARVVGRHADLPVLGGLAAGPGMFALHDPDEITGLLHTSGFTGTAVDAVASTIVIGGGGTYGESVEFLLGAGIVRGLLGGVAPEARPAVEAEVRDALADHYRDGVGIRLGAAGWLVTARTEG